ncbi:TWO-COMPONENT HISTIDINE KINASE [Salix purpurea]|uniref:histidine kinase n=1 Tax=Salix purpurea TaxID=77065 RepID=A0A9Q0W8D8_SALPP|nr:TWO-COMPONENT HISTIDINE KINASE [Salix purpurea]
MKFNKERFRSLKAIVRPSYFLIILVLSSFMFSELCAMIKQSKNRVRSESEGVRNKSFSEIQMTAGLLHRLNSSASNLARALSSYLNGTQLSFVAIQDKVAPTLFLALSTIPELSQVSYIGLDGLLFSFYNDEDQTFSVYSNTSFSSQWFTQPVNRDNGMLYGDAVVSDPKVTVNSSWFQKALNSTSGHSSMETRWNRAQDSLFLNTAAVDGRGVVSLGYPIQVVINHFAAVDFHGGFFHLGTADGQVVVQTKLPNSQIEIHNDTVMVQTMKRNGGPLGHYNISCDSEDGRLGTLHKKIVGIKYMFYCSTLDIAGLKSVYVLAYPRNGLVHLVHRNSMLSLLLLALVFIFIVISLCTYLFLTARATNREMFLCASLIKQTEATQQAERKSMNKTKAFAGANHDVRNSLAAVRASIHFCQEEANPDSKLAAQLVLLENHTKDLLGILNSILDMSKIEAGKTSLEIEDFNLAELLEEVVDMFYPLGMNKGIDIVLDPCDGSILKSSDVRGDRLKLKQILCNLVNNAIKFTAEGHVSIRAVVKKKNFRKEIIASNRTTFMKFLSRFCYNNKDCFSDLDALNTVEENPNEVEFEFEVDDTGKGIPKDKQKSLFEDYVQVKETDTGQEGSGLGLGIVQSLVRVMKGELRIVEKELGERGTCFKFNVFLSSVEPKSAEPEEDRRSSAFHQHFPFMSPKPEGSHVIIFIPGEERRKVLKKYLERLNIKVTIIKQVMNLQLELEKVKGKLDLSFLISGKPEHSLDEYLSKSTSTNSDGGSLDGSLNIKDGGDHIVPHYKKTNSKSSSSIIVLVIDINEATSYSNFENILANFRNDIDKSLCKVVWLDDPVTGHSSDEVKDRATAEGDYVLYKPLHGSCLSQVLSLLPERKGTSHCSLSKFTSRTAVQEAQHFVDSNLPNDLTCSEIIELDMASPQRSSLQLITADKPRVEASSKPLIGKNVLVVEDSMLLQRLTSSVLKRLGASVEVCANGKEAFNEVCKSLSDQKKEGDSISPPYDFIFMDCEMPIMNGFEATRLIRMEEEQYGGVHVPIIALTAHAMPEQTSKVYDAGMDFHLTKPLEEKKMLEVILSIVNE